MKSALKLILALTLGIIIIAPALAQDSADGDKPGGAMLSSLSKSDKMKLFKARKQVLDNNPDLKAEQDDLTKQREALKDQGTNASPDDRRDMMQKFMAHQKKMQTAMLQVDPSLQPVLDQINQQMKDKFQQKAAQAGGN